MNKTAIKIIKRKDAAAKNAEARNASGQKSAAAMSAANNEPSARRKMADTISKWVAERRENRRSEEISAFRKLFGDDFLSGRTT